MTPELAKEMADFFLSVITNEIVTTQNVIRAVPEAGKDYKPDEKSRSALELARHIALGDLFFLDAIANGAFSPYDEQAEKAIDSIAGAADVFQQKWPVALAKVRNLPNEALAKPIDMMGAFNFPAVIYLSFLIRHQVHHRGQLTAYIRAAGGKVPAIYGGSADDAWQPPTK